jgi:hypothetical protein
MYASQGMEKWHAVVNTVMNFGFHKMRVICGLGVELEASEDGLCCIE